MKLNLSSNDMASSPLVLNLIQVAVKLVMKMCEFDNKFVQNICMLI